MSSSKTQRVRDPVHGLIVFRDDSRLDQLAWQLLDTPEFERLRRIKQLGVSEFVFPGATHSRFAHCIGVFHTARSLMTVIRREIGEKNFDEPRSEVAVIAALLHDIGHGPFSHVFEGVRKAQGDNKRHEEWTADIIRNPKGGVAKALRSFRPNGKFGASVAELLESEDPKDIYHAVVSSSFDADRLDYLQRDRLMTGTGAGAIDLDWLMEHVRVAEVNLEAAEMDPGDEDESGDTRPRAPTFCIDIKAKPAAEQFLLSRYTLHEQVYFHKTTRCIEQMISELLKKVANHVSKHPKQASKETGLEGSHPLLRYFGTDGSTVENYLALDDAVVSAAFERMTLASDSEIAELSRRLRERRLYKALDIGSFGIDEGVQRKSARKIDRLQQEGKFKGKVLKDDGASLSIYSQVGGDDEKAHKKLRILDADGHPREISRVSEIIRQLGQKRQLTRYYFENENDRTKARGRATGS